MVVLESKTVIGDYIFTTVHDIEIEKSVDTLSDTAIIKLPTSFKVEKGGKYLFTEQTIKVGDPVTITLGYKGLSENVEFRGFVKKIKPSFPLEIHCEDAFWLLKRNNISKVWKGSVELKEILQEVVKNTDLKLATNIPGFPIDNFIIRNASGAQVLEKIKKDFRLSAFINDENELYCGLRQLTNIAEEVKYDLQFNLVENNLEFKTVEDRKIKIRYTYIAPDGKRKKIEYGDEDGELRTYHTSVISSEAQLKEMAKIELEKLKYDGFDGDLVSFLVPFATRGMIGYLKDDDYEHRTGSYFIPKVRVSFSTSGARRTVFIDTKL